jgi:hypothetical protein
MRSQRPDQQFDGRCRRARAGISSQIVGLVMLAVCVLLIPIFAGELFDGTSRSVGEDGATGKPAQTDGPSEMTPTSQSSSTPKKVLSVAALVATSPCFAGKWCPWEGSWIRFRRNTSLR